MLNVMRLGLIFAFFLCTPLRSADRLPEVALADRLNEQALMQCLTPRLSIIFQFGQYGEILKGGPISRNYCTIYGPELRAVFPLFHDININNFYQNVQAYLAENCLELFGNLELNPWQDVVTDDEDMQNREVELLRLIMFELGKVRAAMVHGFEAAG